MKEGVRSRASTHQANRAAMNAESPVVISWQAAVAALMVAATLQWVVVQVRDMPGAPGAPIAPAAPAAPSFAVAAAADRHPDDPPIGHTRDEIAERLRAKLAQRVERKEAAKRAREQAEATPPITDLKGGPTGKR